MIEATCPACGTLNRVSEGSVPVGAKFVTCADCKSRIAIPPPRASGSALTSASSPRTTDVIDLADLPAPKRASALGPVPPPMPAKPVLPGKPMRPGLAAALDPELPAPKMRAPGPPPSLDLDDLLASPLAPREAVADLPAPKRSAPRVQADLDVVDLPAPKVNRDVTDLLAPKASRDVADLPAPKRPAAPADLAPPRGPLIPDLPAPRMGDAHTRSGPDLPAPKGFFDDLPQPALSKPADLPAPKGFFDDLPQPARSKPADLPAPKGFFDDLPQAKSSARREEPEVPAPKGYYDDIPGLPNANKPEVPAPKGYFDDIPGLPNTSKPEVPAPKGYFDDIPGLPNTSKPEVPAPKGFFDNVPGLPNKPKPEVPAPKGFFDDLPGRAASQPAGRPAKKPDDVAPKGFFDDLPQPGSMAPPAPQPGSRAPAPPDDERDGDLQLESGAELELIAPSSANAAAFDDLDLSRPSVPSIPMSPVRFDPPPRGRAQPAGSPAGAAMIQEAPALELEGAAPAPAKPEPKRPAKVKPPVADAAIVQSRARRNKIALGAVLAALVAGAGGFVLYRRHAAAEERAAALAAQLDTARKSYAARDPQHWQRAAAAARSALDLDAKNPEALGIAAESLLASALADGTAAVAKLGQARGLLDVANGAGISSPQLTRARALSALAAHQPDGAIGQLQPLANGAPKDATLALYLGWALAAKGDLAGAVAAYDRAAADDALKIDALYGRGNARLELADVDGARADFSAVLELAKDHIGAQVGLAAAQPPSAAQQQEDDLVAILARKDIGQADPRAVARAWTLAGAAAMRAGRSDVARERYRKALAAVPQDPAATTGLAETELRDGKVTSAAELIGPVLAVAKDSVAAQLVQSEIEIQQDKLPIAGERLAALAHHVTPLTPLEQSRLYVVTGKLLEAQGKDDAAVEAYAQGAKIARDLDLTPMMAAIGKLAAMTRAATTASDTARATELRGRADQLLGELAQKAEHDPRLAMTLGLGYLQQGDASKAAPWLQKVVEARPNDAEARFQLGRAQLKLGQPAAALEAIAAALRLDPERSEVAVELARTYEALGRDADAGALYTKLLAGGEPSVELRGHAGKFFARTGALDKAGEQGTKIVQADPRNPAGLYLMGEGLLVAGKPGDAKQAFQHALEVDRDPLYLDALGRAAEAMSRGGDREAQDVALRSYLAAAEAAPTMFSPQLGLGRLYVARHEAAKAVHPLLDASRLDPRNAEVMYLLGAAYQELQQNGEATRSLDASVRLMPNPDAYWRLAQLHRDSNRGAEAAVAVGNATRLALETEKATGKQVSWLTEALYLQGRINLDLHNDTIARDAWQLYVGRNPPSTPQLTEVKQLLATALRRP